MKELLCPELLGSINKVCEEYGQSEELGIMIQRVVESMIIGTFDARRLDPLIEKVKLDE